MKILKLIFPVFCWTILFPLAVSAESIHPYLSPAFLNHSVWHDGKSEVNIYDAEEIRYGISRKTEAVQIFVKETHKPDLLVKADNWREKGLMEVMKFNYMITVPTGIYSYRQMLSVFFRKDNFHPIKMTFGSQEWCGNSFKEIVNFRGNSFINFVTYWDNQGSRKEALKLEAGIPFYDALPVLLRALDLPEGKKINFTMLPSQVSSKLTSHQPEKATLASLETTTLNLPMGKVSAKKIQLTHSKGEDLFWFAKEFPHAMLKWNKHDGTKYLLRKTFRLDYWNKTKPGDEKFLE